MDRSQDERLIRLVEQSYDDAWQRGDVEGLVACLTEGAVLVNPRGEIARGRVEIRQALERFLSDEARGSQHHSSILRIEFVTDDVAVVDGEARVTNLPASTEASLTEIVHLYTDILVKRGDTWAIAQVRAYAVYPGW